MYVVKQVAGRDAGIVCEQAKRWLSDEVLT